MYFGYFDLVVVMNDLLLQVVIVNNIIIDDVDCFNICCSQI